MIRTIIGIQNLINCRPTSVCSRNPPQIHFCKFRHLFSQRLEIALGFVNIFHPSTIENAETMKGMLEHSRRNFGGTDVKLTQLLALSNKSIDDFQLLR